MDTAWGEWYRRRQAPVDALSIAMLAVVASALGVRGMWDVFSVLPTAPSPWWGLATALPGCLLTLVKLRAPMIALVAGTVLWVIDLATVGSLGMMVVLMDLLWTAVRRADERRRRQILVPMVIGVSALAIIGGVRSASLQVGVVVALGLGSLFGVTFATAMSLGQAHELAALQMRLRVEEVQRARRELEEQRAGDRRAMARDLHDQVAGHVSAAALRAEAALVAEVDVAGARAALTSVRGASLDAHAALRRMIDVLGAPAASSDPIIDDLIDAIGEARDRGLAVIAEVDGEAEVPDPVRRAVARVVRESLTNASRYAGPGPITVQAHADEGVARVRVTSPLPVRAASTLPDGGWGLRSLDQDIRALGGRFHAGASEDSWVVEATVPAEGRS